MRGRSERPARCRRAAGAPGEGNGANKPGAVFRNTLPFTLLATLIEVKGGGVSVDQVHKLKSVIDRERALVGLFVTLNPQTKQMVAEAAAAGFVETNGRYQRIPILTIEGIPNFREVPRLPMIDTGGFRNVPRKAPNGKQGSISGA